MMTDPDTLRALAKELCEAKGPAYVLDQKIHRIVMEDYFAGDDPPPYTASLDAALPGEDISTISRTASNEVVARDIRARRYVGAHTEPLARRAAALLAMAERKEREG